MTINLIRICRNDEGTYGVLVIDNMPFCLTFELPWKGNMQDISCIPEGVYLCRRTNSPSKGEVYEVLDVPGRTDILFHTGNTSDDTEGCILLGQYFGRVKGKWGVLNSRTTLYNFMERLQGQDTIALQIA